MAVNNENQHEQTGDYRSRPRWSAGKKMDAVLRRLGGEPLAVLSRELGVETHRLAAWRDDFLEGGKEALKGQRPNRSQAARALRPAERKIGQLTMENEILRAVAETRGLSMPPAKRPSSSWSTSCPVAVVGRVLDAPRSTVSTRRQQTVPARPGPVTSIDDHDWGG
jgi:transposase-like protein